MCHENAILAGLAIGLVNTILVYSDLCKIHWATGVAASCMHIDYINLHIIGVVW